VFCEIGGFVTTICAKARTPPADPAGHFLTPLLLKKSTTFCPSSGLPASMRWFVPPACTSTPSPWPTSIKLTESEPEGGGEGPPKESYLTRSHAAKSRISRTESDAKRLLHSAVRGFAIRGLAITRALLVSDGRSTRFGFLALARRARSPSTLSRAPRHPQRIGLRGASLSGDLGEPTWPFVNCRVASFFSTLHCSEFREHLTSRHFGE
jgi:hypothetical protein